MIGRLARSVVVRHFLARKHLLVLSAAALLAACGAAPGTRSSAPALPVAQLVSIGRDMASGLGDPHVKTAWVIATRKNAAEYATTPGAVPPDPHNPRAYLILIRGRFVCGSCSGPVGAKPPRGRVAYDIWIPGHGISDFGLQRRVPRGVHRLGPLVRIRLVPPRIPASELALHPGRGIGPVRLGARVRALNRRLGPTISAGQYVFGPIEVDIRPYHRRVDHLIVLSARATIDGHPLSDGYDRLRHELTGWTGLVCPNGPHVLFRHSANGVSTRLEFTGARFDQAFIGRARPASCSAPFPGG
jgi:hypothetical protein